MKKYFLYLLGLIVISSCDNLKKKDKTSEDDTEETGKKKKPLDDDETADDEKSKKKKPADDETETSEGWSQGERKKFLDQCITDASKEASEEKATDYCNCFLKKAEASYGSYTEADNKMTKTELNTWAAACR